MTVPKYRYQRGGLSTLLLDRGIRLSPDPSKRSGRAFAIILRCSRLCFSVMSFCICSSSRLCIFIITFSTITIQPNIIPPKTAFFIATRAPERKASSPPVTAPAAI